MLLIELFLTQAMDDPTTEMPAHFCGCTGQFRQTFNHIAQGVDVIDVCSLDFVFSSKNLFALREVQAYLSSIESFRGCLPAHCEQDSIK